MKLYIKQLRVNNIMFVNKFNQAKCWSLSNSKKFSNSDKLQLFLFAKLRILVLHTINIT